MPGKGARSGGLNIPYDCTGRVKQFLFFFESRTLRRVAQLQICPCRNLPEFAAVQKVVHDAVDGSSTGTRVPKMWALLKAPMIRRS